MPKIFDPTVGDMRVTKRETIVYVQEYVPWGWEYTQLHNNQTLTSCVAELIRRGYHYIGRDQEDSVFYYRKQQDPDPKAIMGAVCPSCGRDNSDYGNICTADDCPGRNPLPTTAELMPGSTRDEQIREALASIERLYHAGDLTDMDVFHLLNGNKPTGEE